MKCVIKKLFMNFEKEENWLNEMAAKGFQLIHYSFPSYFFEEGNHGEYIYRIELLNYFPSHPESASYIKFMEDVGITCIATHLKWVYFRKKASDGPFDLYTDFESRINHYKRLNHLLTFGLILNLGVALYNAVLWLLVGLPRNFHFNLICALLSFTFVIICSCVSLNYYKVIKKLKKEKQLFE